MGERTRRDPLRVRKLDPRPLLAALSLVGLGFAVGALTTEGVVRLVARQPITIVSPGLYQPDPPRRYRLTPGYRGWLKNEAEFSTRIAVNGHGLRGPEITPEAAGLRILIVGDSFVFGWGVEAQEGLSARLQAELRRTSPGIEVLNGGHPGFGLQDELRWLAAHGRKLQPDLVVLAIMMANDLLDATEKHGRETLSEVVPEAGTADGLKVALYRYSHLFRLIQRQHNNSLASLLGLPESWAVGYLRDMTSALAVEPPALIREGQRASREALTDFAELTRQLDLPWVALLLPVEMQVDPLTLRELCAFVGLDPARHDPNAPTRFFTDVLGALAVPSLDLTPRFRAATADGGQLFFRHDPHWNAAGHRHAARNLADFLTRQGWPDRPLNPAARPRSGLADSDHFGAPGRRGTRVVRRESASRHATGIDTRRPMARAGH